MIYLGKGKKKAVQASSSLPRGEVRRDEEGLKERFLVNGGTQGALLKKKHPGDQNRCPREKAENG